MCNGALAADDIAAQNPLAKRIQVGGVTFYPASPVNPNVVPSATVTANSENRVKRQYLAQCVADGKIPIENQGFADNGLHQTVWAVNGDKDGRESGWLKFAWEAHVEIREIVFFVKTVWTLDECWKDYEVYLGDSEIPVAVGTFEKKSGPQSILLDRKHKTTELTLRFDGSYGGVNPGANEVFIFGQKATTRDMLLAMGGWDLARDAYLFGHRPQFNHSNAKTAKSSNPYNTPPIKPPAFGREF